MSSALPRKLGLLDAISIVVGIVIGGGIFLVPNLVARNLGSVPLILTVWTFAGIVSFFGALACAELGAAFPSTGGQYVFLREAYGPFAGFLCGWTMFTVARSAQIAWMAVTFALYVSYFVPLGAAASKALGLAAIALFAGVNYRGATPGAAVQKSFTAAKVAGLLLIIGSAFLFRGRPANAACRAHSRILTQQFRSRARRLPSGLRRMGATERRRGRDPRPPAQRAARSRARQPGLPGHLSTREHRVPARPLDPGDRRNATTSARPPPSASSEQRAVSSFPPSS